jgi:tRNA 2-thiouridine synthesizing protein C
MNRIAFIFSSSPHGTASGREGLDALLATAALSDEIGVFFIGDGILQLLPQQNPAVILSRPYTVAFALLPVYDIENIFLCSESLAELGLHADKDWIVPVKIVNSEAFRTALSDYHQVLTF